LYDLVTSTTLESNKSLGAKHEHWDACPWENASPSGVLELQGVNTNSGRCAVTCQAVPRACCQSVDSVPTCRQHTRGSVRGSAPSCFPPLFVSQRFPTRRQVPLALAWRLLCMAAVYTNGSKILVLG